MASEHAVYHDGKCIGFLSYSKSVGEWVVYGPYDPDRPIGFAEDRYTGHAVLIERYAKSQVEESDDD